MTRVTAILELMRELGEDEGLEVAKQRGLTERISKEEFEWVVTVHREILEE
jgi:hypothetical protein